MTKPKYVYEVGGFYEFEYNGGSNPGATRRVHVEDVQRNYVRGMDLDKGEYRTFTKSMIVNPRPLTEEIRVDFKSARQELVDRVRAATAEDLADMVSTLTGYPVTFDRITGEFKTTRVVAPEVKEFDFVVTTRTTYRLPIHAVGDHENKAETLYNENQIEEIVKRGSEVNTSKEVSNFSVVE